MKKNFSFTLILIVLLFSSIKTVSQNKSYPRDYFSPPLDIPLVLAGNFGELRSNHFHSGIDIKTQGVEGKKVLCAANGYVSRIKISTKGYGKAIYVSHPNGYTTVYAHLKKFNPKIEAYVKGQQYAKKSFEIEIFPQAGKLPLKRGELLAISGNSGGSTAPHLHFEIRDSKSEKVLNPLFFGFKITDTVEPIIKNISIYPLNEKSSVNGSTVRKDFRVNKEGKLNLKTPIILHGEIGFGIETFDRLNAANNKCGVYKIELFKDNEKIYVHEIEKFAFRETRYMNAHMDFEKDFNNLGRTQRSFLLDNNRLSIYKNLKNKGRVNFLSKGTHTMKYVITDVYGNQSQLSFQVMSSSQQNANYQTVVKTKPVKLMKYNEKNSFQNENIIIYMPPNILYEDLPFTFQTDDTLPKALCPTYRIHNEKTPLHSYMILSIKIKGLSEQLKRKSLVISHTDKDGIYAEGGTWKGDYIVVKTRSFGGYAVMLDTTAPKITPVNISQQSDMSKKWSIMMKISDNLSGIDSYTAKVDGKWILMEYDAKRDLLTHHFDETVTKGNHTFELLVKDEVGNQSTYKAEFIR